MDQTEILSIRDQFPILQRVINDTPLIYLDNAATTQKPNVVIDRIMAYYRCENSNVHRGVHQLSQIATDNFEATRSKAQSFINAAHIHEIIITKGTTEGINLIASSYGNKFLNEGDEIIISALEHHSNIVPWQILCENKGAILKIIPVDDNGDLDIDTYVSLLSSKTKIVSVNYISNTLGTINPIKTIIELAHAQGAIVVVDAAQAAKSIKMDVQDLDADFLVFSGHKMYGPSGVGILYGKENILESMPPYQAGGSMIKEVQFSKTTYNSLPYKFEAGTPNIEAVIGLGSAIDFINSIGLTKIKRQEDSLLKYATQKLQEIDGLSIIGLTDQKSAIVSFIVEGAHPYDIGMILDKQGIAVRTGYHCTQPLMNRFDITGTVRASFAVYNQLEEVDKLILGVKKALKLIL